MKRIILILFFFCCVMKLFTQTIPLEVAVGQRNYYTQFSLYKAMDESGFGFFNSSSLMLNYINSNNSEIMSQTYFTYCLLRNLKLGLGTFYASLPGLKPSLSLQYVRATKLSTIVLSPRIDLKQKPSFDLMLALEHKPLLSNTIKLYTRIQVMFNYTRNRHNRSYQYLRLGLQYKESQFGMALNLDAYGNEYTYYKNYGIFYKTNI